MSAPGKAFRAGITLPELMATFPTEEKAAEWFEDLYWPRGRRCGHCGGDQTAPVPNARPMPYRCRECRKYFSVKTGTAMADSKVPLQKWAIAIYLCLTSLKSVSSMKLHRDLGVTQKTAWFMLHRLREAWARQTGGPLSGPVEVDETYMGGKRHNMSLRKRAEQTGRGPVGKTPVVGVKDRETNEVRAQAIENTDAETLQGFVADHVAPEAKVYTDDAAAYDGLPQAHESVRHSVSEYVRGQAHTNGVESFWSMLKRAHKGTFHKISPKHLNRYVQEFAGRHNLREQDTLEQMCMLALGLAGKRLKYHGLIADNGLPSEARSE